MCKQVEGMAPERLKHVIAGSVKGLFASVDRQNFMAVSDGGISWQRPDWVSA